MSSRLRWEQDVAACVATRPYLLPIFGDVLGVVDHLRDWNPDLFVVLNLGRVMDKLSGRPYQEWRPLPIGTTPKWGAWWEVHNLSENPTLATTVRFGELDGRTVEEIRKTDTRVNGGALYAEVVRHNRELEEKIRSDAAREREALAYDLHKAVAQDAWGPTVFGPRQSLWTPTAH